MVTKKMMLLVAITATVLSVISGKRAKVPPSPVQSLSKDLFDEYDPHIRPVYNKSHAINLVHNVRLYQILEANERMQYIRLSLWVDQVYRNELLGWNPADYDGIEKMEVFEDRIWTPDIYVYNSLDLNMDELTLATNSWVVARQFNKTDRTDYPESNETQFWGSAVIHWYPMIGRFSCMFDTLYFPYDTQNCSLIFGSWSYTASEIDCNPFKDEVDMSEFTPSEEWDVVSFTMRKVVKVYKCCPQPYATVIAELIIKRKPLYYVINLILPAVVIAQVAFLGFFSDGGGERAERVGLGMDTLVAMSILLIIVSSLMPITSSYVPMTGLFMFVSIILIAVGVLASCLVTHVHNTGLRRDKVPPWVRKLFLEKISRYLLVSIPKRKGVLRSSIIDGPNHHSNEVTMMTFVPEEGDDDEDALNDRSGTQLLWREIADLRRDMLDVRRFLNKKEGKLFNEWRALARVLDRILLLVLSAILWTMTLTILLVRSVRS